MTVTRSVTRSIPLMQPYVPPGTIEAVSEVLGSRWIGQGPKVEEFERQFSERLGRPAVAVGSCTDALHLAYLLAGIGPGDEVLTPLFTCTATNIPLLYCGAKIRFVDVDPRTLNLDLRDLQRKVTERTTAIVVVHYGGSPVDVHSMTESTWNLDHMPHIRFIEDCAQALGGYPVGGWADYACFSFQAVKHVTTGDGGMLSCPPRQLEQAKRMRWFGIDRAAKLNGTWANDITEVGYKYQMTDIGATMGLAGLEHLDAQIAYRRALVDQYERGLWGTEGVELIHHPPGSACWLCTVLVEDRNSFRRKLAAEGIESDQVHYRNDRYGIFAAFREEFPGMDSIDGRYLCLPLHMGMDIEDVQHICEVIRSGW